VTFVRHQGHGFGQAQNWIHQNIILNLLNLSVMIVFLLRVMVLNKQILPYYKIQIIVFTDPATALSMFMLSFKFVIQCRLFEWKRICAVCLIVNIYVYCRL